MTGEVERLKTEEAQAALEKKRAAESLMDEVHRSNAEQVALLLLLPCQWLKITELAADDTITYTFLCATLALGGCLALIGRPASDW